MAWGVWDYPDPPMWWQEEPEDEDETDGYEWYPVGVSEDYGDESFP